MWSVGRCTSLVLEWRMSVGCGSLRRGSELGPGPDALGTRLAVRLFARLD